MAGSTPTVGQAPRSNVDEPWFEAWRLRLATLARHYEHTRKSMIETPPADFADIDPTETREWLDSLDAGEAPDISGADNLKTLDGMAAFMHQVNMVLNKADLPHLPAALFSGIEYHNRLYKPYFQAADSHSAI